MFKIGSEEPHDSWDDVVFEDCDVWEILVFLDYLLWLTEHTQKLVNEALNEDALVLDYLFWLVNEDGKVNTTGTNNQNEHIQKLVNEAVNEDALVLDYLFWEDGKVNTNNQNEDEVMNDQNEDE